MIFNSKIVNIFTLVGFALVCGIGFYSMNERPDLVSSFFTLTFIWIAFFFGYTINGLRDRYLLIPAVLCILLSSLNVFALAGNGGFDYYKKLIMFICFVLLCYIFSVINKTSRYTIFGIFLINLVLAVSYIYVFNTGFSFFEGEYLLTLGFDNPNLAGMFLLNSFLYIALIIIYLIEFGKKLIYTLPFIGLAVFLCHLIILTKCRSSIVSVIIFIFILLLDLFGKQKLFLNKTSIIIWTLFPIIFVFLYTNFIESLHIDLSMSFDDASKGSASRNIVWLPALKSLSEHWILGDYFGISEGTGHSQMHNTHLDVWCSYGLVPFSLYLVYLYRIVTTSYSNAFTTFNRCAIYAFYVCFISGTFEASIVAGGAGIYILSCGFLFLANTNTKDY